MGQPAARSLLSQQAVLRQSFRQVNDLLDRYVLDPPPGQENLASTLARLSLDLQETVEAKMNRQERLLYPALIRQEEAGGVGPPDPDLPAAQLGTLIALAVKESDVALMAARALRGFMVSHQPEGGGFPGYGELFSALCALVEAIESHGSAERELFRRAVAWVEGRTDAA